MNSLNPWLADLEEEELLFIKKFILSSGSLKEMAACYNVTYPTVRLRLDRLIQKIETKDEKTEDPYVTYVRQLAQDNKITSDTAKNLIVQYRKQINGF